MIPEVTDLSKPKFDWDLFLEQEDLKYGNYNFQVNNKIYEHWKDFQENQANKLQPQEEEIIDQTEQIQIFHEDAL